MVWHGWGDPAGRHGVPAHALAHLRREVGLGRPQRPVPLAEVRLRPPELPAATTTKLAAIVGRKHLRDSREARILHAGGKSYPDLVRRRSGDAEDAPDAVVMPGSHAEVVAVLAACALHRVAVVPFGGGTSVVGGVEPVRGEFGALVALDLSRLDALLHLDPVSRTATVQAGMRGPALEAALAARGFTLGHLPQSFEFSSVGGWVVTRSAGQASTGYGRADRLVRGLRVATPVGDLDLGRSPASAAGPDLRELICGSEGILGVVTEATLAVRPAPPTQRFEGWFLPSFSTGADALRVLVQTGRAADVCRLSDEMETRTSLALAGSSRLSRAYLRLRRRRSGCLVILGYDGAPDEISRRRRAAAAVLREHGGVYAGQGPGRSWAAGRFGAPYLRDDLLDLGVMVETLETATDWSGLERLHDAVATALTATLSARGTPPLVLCHVSHLYDSGASLYFTFLARQQDTDPLGQWRAAKQAAGDAIVAAGGTITHHHAVGTDHRPWLTAEIGAAGVAALRGVKAALDPTGILNPGKLLPPT